MKLYIKRDVSADGGGFEIFNALGELKYTVSVSAERQKQQLVMNTAGSAADPDAGGGDGLPDQAAV